MPRDDDAGQVFDVSKPNRTGPDPTSRPIIVGHQPMMADPMVKDQSEQASNPPVSEHRTITVNAPDAHDDRQVPAITPPVHEQPPTVVTPPPPEPSVPAAPAVAPQHPESVKAAAADPVADQAATATPPGDLHLTHVDDLIGHSHGHHGAPHHSEHKPEHVTAADVPPKEPKPKKKGGKTGLWILLALIVVVLAGYLLIDSRTIKTSIKLPFHVFKQPVVASPTAATTTTTVVATTPKATDPYANWKTFVLSNEKLSFQYPSTWTIKDNTATVNDQGDSITISGPNNFEMTINTGLETYALPAGGTTIDYSDPIAFLAQQGYMDFVEVGKQNTGTTSFVLLSLSKTDPTVFPATKNIPNSNIKVSWHYLGADGKTVVTKTQTFVKSDPNYVNAKLMLQSMHY